MILVAWKFNEYEMEHCIPRLKKLFNLFCCSLWVRL